MQTGPRFLCQSNQFIIYLSFSPSSLSIPPQSPRVNVTSVFVTGLPVEIHDEASFRSAFTASAVVEALKENTFMEVPEHPRLTTPMGLAHLTFNTEQHASKFVAGLHNTRLGGSLIFALLDTNGGWGCGEWCRVGTFVLGSRWLLLVIIIIIIIVKVFIFLDSWEAPSSLV